MKDIIKVTVKVRRGKFENVKTDLLCVGIFSKEKKLDGAAKVLNAKLDGEIERLIKLGDFKGSEGTSTVLYDSSATGARRVLLVGLGERKDVTIDKLRDAAAMAAGKGAGLKAANIGLVLHSAAGNKFDPADTAQAITEGIYLGSYSYDEFVTKSENGRSKTLTAELIEADSSTAAKIGKGVSAGVIIGQAQCLARTIANRPANVMYPARVAEEARKIAAKTPGLSCTVFGEKQLKHKKMGGIIAVGQGSSNKPCMIILKYTPRGAKRKIALVGKAITFDSGGISIKPAADMDAMKMDKSGGAAVISAMKAIAELKLPVNVLGVICAAENKPGSESYRPGDIITTYSGKTVEILNTDAEGRMVLCDGIHYAKQQKYDTIVDIATLTGACMVALGAHKAGLMSNDDGLLEQLKQAAKDSGETVWHMPSGPEYLEEMKSKIADLKNTGGKWGGACTAAAFLGAFAGDTKWAHVDMAGTMEPSEPMKKFTSPGALGFGVRLLTAFVRNFGKNKK